MTEETKAEGEEIRISDKAFSIAAVVAVFLAGFILFGITGLRTLLGIAGMVLPVYLILGIFKIEIEERLIYSVFASLALFSLAVFYLNRLVPSLRLSIIIAFAVLTALGLVLNRKS
jgi:hypothetical protein